MDKAKKIFFKIRDLYEIAVPTLAFAMLFGLIVVPVVSWISPKLDKKVIDAAFKDMPDDIPARIDDIKA